MGELLYIYIYSDYPFTTEHL